MEVQKCATCQFLDAHPPKFNCLHQHSVVTGLTVETIAVDTGCVFWKQRVTTLSVGERPIEERKASVDIDRVVEFSQAMAKKWSKGRTEYGVYMKFDPLDEAMMECVDTANYMMETYYRIKKLKETVKGLSQETK